MDTERAPTGLDGPEAGWHSPNHTYSLPEAHKTVSITKTMGFWRKMFAFSGPGFLVAVGYMDPGNWATDLEGGSRFGYTLLSIVMLSNFMAILLQTLCLRLGIATGRDLAQACSSHYSKPVNIVLWLLCEIAIAACDLAEVVGSAIALNLLFHIPLIFGVCITALDVLLVLYLQQHSFRYLEALVVTLILTIGGCFAAELLFAHPNALAVAKGFIPAPGILMDKEMLYVAIGIIGATVMPHNLYLHSSIVQTRNFERTSQGKAEAIKFATIDSTVALMGALFINAAILIVSAAVFYTKNEVKGIEEAYELLSPAVGVTAASVIFALALLASGQNATLTGTLAGQIVMEGFINVRLKPWLRRLISRSVAIVPTIVCIALYGDKSTQALLVLSQVVLSLQLPFAVVPLILFTSDRKKMNEFVNPRWLMILAWLTAAIIIALNGKMVYDVVIGWVSGNPA